MLELTQTIYCDESGATGNVLLDDAQPFFIYSSLALNPERAEQVAEEAIANFKLAGEIKGANLLRHHKGREAITWLLEQVTPDARIVICHKKYALACKLFEYIFEPVVAKVNSAFYSAGFHLYISHLLYVTFAAGNEAAEEIMSRFQALMRERSPESFTTLIQPLASSVEVTREVGLIAAFALGHREVIEKEIISLAGEDPTGRWILDLTTSGLFSLLCYWGRRFGTLEVLCDDAKPLKENLDALNSINPFGGGQHGDPGLITFCLDPPIELVSSKKHRGIQLADVIASAVGYALKSHTVPESSRWLSIVESCVDEEGSVLPQPFWLGQIKNQTAPQRYILDELCERTRLGNDLLKDFGIALQERINSKR